MSLGNSAPFFGDGFLRGQCFSARNGVISASVHAWNWRRLQTFFVDGLNPIFNRYVAAIFGAMFSKKSVTHSLKSSCPVVPNRG